MTAHTHTQQTAAMLGCSPFTFWVNAASSLVSQCQSRLGGSSGPRLWPPAAPSLHHGDPASASPPRLFTHKCSFKLLLLEVRNLPGVRDSAALRRNFLLNLLYSLWAFCHSSTPRLSSCGDGSKYIRWRPGEVTLNVAPSLRN